MWFISFMMNHGGTLATMSIKGTEKQNDFYTLTPMTCTL